MLNFREATISDAEIILELIHDLARYEKMEEEVTATKEDIISSVFMQKKARVIIFEKDGKTAGYSLFFNNYSTFLCNAGIYIEDIFVKEEYRNKGIGKAFFEEITKIAKKEGARRIDWACLKWNTPSIEFYKKLGATHIKDWDLFRITL